MIIVLPLRGQEVLAYSMATAAKYIGCTPRSIKRLWALHGQPKPYHNSKKSKNGYNYLTIHEINILHNMLKKRDDEIAGSAIKYTPEFCALLRDTLLNLHKYYDGLIDTIPSEALTRETDEDDAY